MRAARRQTAVLALAALLAVAASGCEVGYLARAAYEEGRLLWNRRPISDELTNPGLDPEHRDALAMVLKVREFARERLGLNVGGAYRTISQVDQDAIVWVVMAAPATSLRPLTWWFPIVGSVPYRGYFARTQAEAEAQSLGDEGYDTLVRPAVAFSSLGFFDDPLLSNLLALNRVVLAGTVIHELFHRTFFLASNVTFDESAATWVGSRGAAEFFAETEGPTSRDAVAARAVVASNLTFARFLLQAQAQLLRLYGSGLPKNEILRRRKALFAQIRTDYARLKPSLSGLDRFDLDRHPLNNAALLDYLLYFHNLWDFDALDRLSHHNLPATIKAIITLAQNDPQDPFYAVWRATHLPSH